MKLNNFLVIVLFLTPLSASSATEGCALLSLGKVKAKKVAMIRAKTEWIKLTKGVSMSGRDFLFLNEKGTLDKNHSTITQMSSGIVQNSFKAFFKEKLIDGERYLCAVVNIKI